MGTQPDPVVLHPECSDWTCLGILCQIADFLSDYSILGSINRAWKRTCYPLQRLRL